MKRRTFLQAVAGAAPAVKLPGEDQVIGADRLIWRRTNPDFAIYLPSGYGDRTNQQVVAAVTPNGTFIVTWTLGAYEGAPDHRQVVSRSTDGGRTWSPPLVVDSQSLDKQAGDGRRAQYGFPFVVPATGRVYIFYSKNMGQNQVREDTTAVLKFVYSDDDGVTWRRGPVVPLPRCEWSHPDPQAHPNWISIYAPILTRKGTVICGVGRYKAGPDLYKGWPGGAGGDRETELVFFRFDNILTERDPSKLTVTVFPEGLRGLRIPRKDNAKFVWSNEPSLTELSDGRIFTTIRTRNDAIYYTLSSDQGRSWTEPEPLRYTNGGEIMQNPNAPCPVIRLSDGRLVLMFYNRPNGRERQFGPRDPVYLSVGRETLDKKQPVEFGPPKLFMDIKGEMPPGGTAWPQIASYSSFLEHQGKLYLFYNDCKYFILGKVVPEKLLR